jgi:hypothetical protein
MISRYFLVSVLALQAAFPSQSFASEYFYRYTKTGLLTSTGSTGPTNPNDPTNPPDPTDPGHTDSIIEIADQSHTVLGMFGSPITSWKPLAPGGWPAAVIDGKDNSAWPSSGLHFSANHDLSTYGLSLNTMTGSITGTPSQAFVFNDFTITVSDGDKSNTTSPFWLGVEPATALAVAANQKTSYTFRAGTAFSTDPISVSNAAGSLTFDKPSNVAEYGWDRTTGILNWTSSQAGSDTFTTTISDEFNRSLPFSFIVNYLPVISVGQLTQLDVIGTWSYDGNSTNRKPTADGILGTASWYSFDVPNGLSYNVDTGVISGRVTESGQQGIHNVSVLVVDDADYSQGSGILAINVLPPFHADPFADVTLKQGVSMTPASVTLRDSASNNPYTNTGLSWRIKSGSLPPGITTQGTGANFTFSGKPTAQGTFTSIWEAEDANGWKLTLAPITFTVEARDPLSINDVAATTAVGRRTYTSTAPLVTISATNVMGAPSWSASSLPAGLAIDPSTGAITGTITSGSEQGTNKLFSITVLDGGDGSSISKSFQLTVNAPFTALSYSPPVLKVGTTMAAGGINLRDTANTPYTGHGVTASLVGGSLPPGLTASVVNDQLQFSGTPTVQGTFQPQYKLTDADGWNITPNRIFFTVQP